MAVSAAYPVELSHESISIVVDIIRHNQFAARKQEFGLHGWWLIGSLQKIVLGMPKPQMRLTKLPRIADAEAVNYLQKIYASAGHDGASNPNPAPSSIPQEFIGTAILFQLIEYLIKKLLEGNKL